MNCHGDDNEDETSTLGALLEEIAFRRRRDARRPGGASGGGGGGARHLQQSTTYWTDLFVRHFLFTHDPVVGEGSRKDPDADHDDLLFFIRRTAGGPACATLASAAATAMRNEVFSVEVFRKDSRKLPIGDPDVDWEETVYLNLIIHHLDYTLTLAVCSRTSPKNLQVLRRYSQKVYATPSRRKMQESKADAEEMTYPYLSFCVDDYEDRFNEVVIRDGESVGVELTASDPGGSGLRAVLFSACVPYEAIHRVYEARASLTVRKRLSQTNLFSLFGGKSYGESRIEFVRLTGPQGHAELAISRVKDHYGNYSNGGCETPSSEPATDLLDLYDSDLEGDDQDYGGGHRAPSAAGRGKPNMVGAGTGGHRQGRTHQRRLSDPSSALGDFIRVGVGAATRATAAGCGARAAAAAAAVVANQQPQHQPQPAIDGAFDVGGDATCEIYAGDLLDEFEEAKYHPVREPLFHIVDEN